MTRSEVLKFSAGGFRDFTRIAASDPTMWRDVFLANKDAVLEMLGRFNEDIVGADAARSAAATATRCSSISRALAPSAKGIVDIGQGFAGARISAVRIRTCRTSRCQSLTRRRGLEQRRCISDRDRPEEHRSRH